MPLPIAPFLGSLVKHVSGAAVQAAVPAVIKGAQHDAPNEAKNNAPDKDNSAQI